MMFLFSTIPSNEDDIDAGMAVQMKVDGERGILTILSNVELAAKCNKLMNKWQSDWVNQIQLRIWSLQNFSFP
jgi:hypothetical protein